MTISKLNLSLPPEREELSLVLWLQDQNTAFNLLNHRSVLRFFNMTRNPLAVILGIISFLAISMSNSVQAQSTGKLTLDLLSHFQEVYSAAATATDKTSAENAVTTISSELKQVDSITALLSKSDKPTDAEMSSVAEATAKLEVKLNKLIQTMSRNLKNQEVRKLIGPSMRQFDAKAGAARGTMDKLYPVRKMVPLVKAAKARLQIQN